MKRSHYQESSPLRKLIAMIVEDRKEFLAIIVYSFFHSLLFLAVPLAAQGLVNVVVSGLYLQPLIVLTGALLFGLLSAGLLTLVRFYLVEVMRERIFARVALRVGERLPRVCHRTLSESNGPELMNRFFDVINIQKSWFKLAYEGPGAVLEIVVGVFLLGIYGTELFGLSVVMIGIGCFLIVIAGFNGLKSSLAESGQKYRVAEWLEEMVRCQDALKLNSRPDFWVEETDRRVVRFLTERRKHFWVIVRQKTVYYTLSAVALSGMLGMGGYLVIQGQLTLGQLVAAELVIWGILKASQKLIGLTESFFDLLTGLEKVSVITAMEVDEPGRIRLKGNGTGARVNLDSLYFTFHPSLPPAIDSLDLDIEPGEVITILGGQGSGKSTLINLLSGFLRPVKGAIEIDEVDLREFEPNSLSDNVSVVCRQSDLFAGTLLDNVCTGREIGLHNIKELLNSCDGRSVLRHLSEGLNSQLTSSGRAISGSEKDTLLLTRALAGRPRLLLLDESLAFLSERQQAHFARYLKSLGKSCTVVSTLPIPALAAVSDRILILEEGRVVESGTPESFVQSPDSALRVLHPGFAMALAHYLSESGGQRDD